MDEWVSSFDAPFLDDALAHGDARGDENGGTCHDLTLELTAVVTKGSGTLVWDGGDMVGM